MFHRDGFEGQISELQKQITDKENEMSLVEEQHGSALKDRDSKITSLNEVLQNDVYLREQQKVGPQNSVMWFTCCRKVVVWLVNYKLHPRRRR